MFLLMSKTLRIASVTGTGRRYIVNRIDFTGPEGIVHTWGEVVRIRAKTRRGRQVGIVREHGESLNFLQSAVVISEVSNTPEFSRGLFEDYIRALRAAGHIITKHGRNYRGHGVDVDHAAKKVAREMGVDWYGASEADRRALRELGE